MTDAEIICEWMETKPTKSILDITRCNEPSPGKWWTEKHPDSSEWYPRRLTLDALYEVEERLSDDQWDMYEREVASLGIMSHGHCSESFKIHLSRTHRTTALAAVLRAGIRTPVEREKP